MKNNIIVLAASKGGVGKSTTAINLAKAFQDDDKTVLIIDLDRANQTLMKYAAVWREYQNFEEGEGEEAEAPLPPMMQLAPGFTSDDLLRYAETADFVIVDMQAGFQRDLQKVAAVTSLLLVPTRLGPKEWMPALETARDGASFARLAGASMQVRLLLNDIEMGRPATMAMLEAVQRASLPAPLMSTLIPHRAGINTAGSLGLTVFDYGPTRPIRKLYRALAAESATIMSGLPVRSAP